jgi:hypothetical protein
VVTRRGRGDLTAQRRQQAIQQNKGALNERDRKAGIVPRSQSQAGDFTGKESARLSAEKAAELAEAQKRVGMVNQVDTIVEQEGVFDALGGGVQLSPEAENQIEEVGISYADDSDVDALGGHTPAPSDPMRNFQDPELQQVEKVVAPNPDWLQEEDEPEVVEAPTMRFRVNEDIEDMTYGLDPKTRQPRNLNLVRGRWYTGPRHLVQHLESRGLVYH